MKNVFSIAVFPIEVQVLVVASRYNRCIIEVSDWLLQISSGASLSLVDILGGGLEVHPVGVDDFGLFFKVESVFMVLCKCIFLAELLLVVGDSH